MMKYIIGTIAILGIAVGGFFIYARSTVVEFPECVGSGIIAVTFVPDVTNEQKIAALEKVQGLEKFGYVVSVPRGTEDNAVLTLSKDEYIEKASRMKCN